MWLRTIVEEQRFLEDFDNFRRLYPGLDKLHITITYTLARHPRVGNPLEIAPDFRSLYIQARSETPAFWLLYTFDENNVYLHSLKLAED